jgi:hypothetical protein
MDIAFWILYQEDLPIGLEGSKELNPLLDFLSHSVNAHAILGMDVKEKV